ncbi:MAG: site-specific DNA-methyltransferase [Spirochaetes bacterium]|nr:site-specific DNA-methyltransferase [Spirochaetota bacterium]
MQNLLNDLTELLSKDERLSAEGKLLKNKVIELALAMDSSLIKLLLKNEKIKKHFFTEVDGILVFDKINFQKFVSNKEFLPDSYTAFKNKIGIVNENGEYFSKSQEVVLAWPYKDCILEGGQTKEDQEREEIFWNETLAPDEIERLCAPKVITNFSRYSGKKGIVLTSNDKFEILNENLLLKGNNLLSLCSLKKLYSGKIKCIYIDPPYNPDSNANTFIYNNSFNESTWLTFMKNRIEVAKELLSKDGVFIIAIDDNEFLELGVLVKELFPNHELHIITIVHNPRGVQGSNFSYTHEYAFFIIPKGSISIGERKIDESEIYWSNLRNWGGESLREDARNCFYPVIIENEEIIGFGDVLDNNIHPKQTEKKGNKYYIYPIDTNGVERKWRYARQSVEEIKNLLRVKKSKNGYEIEIGKDFGTYKTVWVDSRYDANEYGTKIVSSLVPNNRFNFPKSLYNVYDCLHAVVSKDKDAIVLDFFGGSGTTAHAVLDLNEADNGNRKFIICEQMDYVETITRERINSVIKNKKTGSFIYCELMELNEAYINKIKKANSTKELLSIWDEMQKKAFISYKVDSKSINENISDFKEFSLKDQKNFLIEILDKNQMYVNYSEIDDNDYNVSETDKKLNKMFYGEV